MHARPFVVAALTGLCLAATAGATTDAASTLRFGFVPQKAFPGQPASLSVVVRPTGFCGLESAAVQSENARAKRTDFSSHPICAGQRREAIGRRAVNRRQQARTDPPHSFDHLEETS